MGDELDKVWLELGEHERRLLTLLADGTPPEWGAWVGAVGESLHARGLAVHSWGGEATARGFAVLRRVEKADLEHHRARADLMSQVLTPAWMLLQRLVEEWDAREEDGRLCREDYGRGEYEEILEETIAYARPVLAKLRELQPKGAE